MKHNYLLVILCLCSGWAQAEIYKAVDADGHVTYSSAPIKGGKKITLEPATTPPAGQPQNQNDAKPQTQSSDAQKNFPRIDSQTQKSREDARRKILQDELDTEEKLLAEAKQNQQIGSETPEVYRTKDGRTLRNVAKYDEKMKALNEQVEQHQRNVDALKTELSKF